MPAAAALTSFLPQRFVPEAARAGIQPPPPRHLLITVTVATMALVVIYLPWARNGASFSQILVAPKHLPSDRHVGFIATRCG